MSAEVRLMAVRASRSPKELQTSSGPPLRLWGKAGHSSKSQDARPPSIHTSNTHGNRKDPMTKTLPKPRKKSPRTTGAPRATKKTSDRLKELWATPEFREKMKQRDQARIAAAKLNPTRFSRYRVPDGMRRSEAEY